MFDKKGKPLYPVLTAELDAMRALRPTGGLMLPETEVVCPGAARVRC
jgi:hypothetical protein